MNLSEFKRKIADCRRAIEVDLAVNALFPHLVGTPAEHLEALQCADARLVALMEENSGEGDLGGRSAVLEMAT